MESQYLVVIEVCGPNRLHRTVQQQLTYEVTHLRPGKNQWSLVSQEDYRKPAQPASAGNVQSALSK